MEEVENLQDSLQIAENKLNKAQAYINSIENNGFMGYQADNIYAEIENLNNTLKNLYDISISNNVTLTSYQNDVQELLVLFMMLQYNASQVEGVIYDAYETSQSANSLANNTRSFSMNISSVMSTLNAINASVMILHNDTLPNAEVSVNSLLYQFNVLDGNMGDLRHQLVNLTDLAVMLLQSAERINNQSQWTLNAVQSLMVSTCITLGNLF